MPVGWMNVPRIRVRERRGRGGKMEQNVSNSDNNPGVVNVSGLMMKVAYYHR